MLDGQQLIEADTTMAISQMANLFDGQYQRMPTRIDDHEIVADAVHLAEMQRGHAFQ